MKQHYKDFCKEYIGESDIASLILVGCGKKRLLLKELGFDGDDSYSAYIVDGGDVVIGSHYEKVAEFHSWMKVYDDYNMVKEFHANKIIVYRAGGFGCIIQLINS